MAPVALPGGAPAMSRGAPPLAAAYPLDRRQGPPGPLQTVRVADGPHQGALRLSDLREIIPPEWDGVGAMAFNHGPAGRQQTRWLLLAERGGRGQLLDLEGRLLPVMDFTHAKIVREPTTYLQLIDTQRQRCQWVDSRGVELVPEPMALQPDQACPALDQDDGSLFFTTLRGMTAAYVRPGAKLHPLLAPLPGRYVDHVPRPLCGNEGRCTRTPRADDIRALVVYRKDLPRPYRVVAPDGSELLPDGFDQTRPGCTHLELRRKGEPWQELGDDGKVVPLRRFCFS